MRTSRTLKLTQTALLTAIILLLTFTNLGYIKAGVIEITLIALPVVIGSSLMGVKIGAVLGTVFGVTSFIQCFGMSAFGAALLAINPVFTFILCVVPRILVGIVPALIVKLFDREKKQNGLFKYSLSCLSGALTNTVLFTGFLIALFGRTSYITELSKSIGANGVLAFFVAFVGINGIIEAAVCLVLGALVCKALSGVSKNLSIKN